MRPENDLFGVPINAPRAARPALSIGYASRPGTGPKGQRCNTCRFRMVITEHGRRASKCEIVAAKWTTSSETDIKHNAPACSDWQRRIYKKIAIEI